MFVMDIPVICEGNKVVHQRRQRKRSFVGLHIVCHEGRYGREAGYVPRTDGDAGDRIMHEMGMQKMAKKVW